MCFLLLTRIIYDHTALVAQILQLRLIVKIEKLEQKVESLKHGSLNTNPIFNKKDISTLFVTN